MTPRKAPARDERGDTLIEVLIALVIIGLTATAVLGSFATTIAGSAEHREYANIDTALRSFASAATYQLQQQPNPEFAACATPGSYQIVAAYPSSAAAGSQIEVFATGFAASTAVGISLGGTSLTGDIVSGGTTATNGTVAAVVDLPSTGLAVGTNGLTVTTGGLSGTGAFSVSPTTPVSTSLSNYRLALSSIEYWGGSSFGTTCTQGGNSPQLLTVTATSPTSAADSLSFVVINPEYFSSSVPVFDSTASASFVAGQPGSFLVRASGQPTPTLTYSGTLPSGLTFTDNRNGTATIAGTPAAGTSGSYPLVLTASNGVVPNATQDFSLLVDGPPSITSASSTSFTAGTAGSFTVTTSGIPTPMIGRSGTLPNGVTFADNGDGTATLSGTPMAGQSGAFPFTIIAGNGVAPNATQNFTLYVDTAPTITSAPSTTFDVGVSGTFTVTTSGYPAVSSLTDSGTLPTGVSFVNNGNGTATISGTPASGTSNNYTITITASNGVSPNATQSFTLAVDGPPSFTSASSDAFATNATDTFTVTTSGLPYPGITYAVTSGALPTQWTLTITPNANGTLTLSGSVPKKATVGSVQLTFTASNGNLPNATQVFTLKW